MLFRAVDAGRREDFFKRTVLSVLALTSITEFVLNLRPLGLRQGDFFGEFPCSTDSRTRRLSWRTGT
jgi:hypothetical protein